MNHFKFDIGPLKENHNIFQSVQTTLFDEVVHCIDNIARCVGMWSNELPSTESKSNNSFVKIDIWVIGEDFVDDIERYGYISAVDGEGFHEIEESIFQKVSDFL